MKKNKDRGFRLPGPYFRRPWSILLRSLLPGLMLAAALVCSVQCMLDGHAMKRAVSSTAYIGMITDRRFSNAMLRHIPEEIVQSLENSEHVERVMTARIHSAVGTDLISVADGFGCLEELNKKLVVEGTVTKDTRLSGYGHGVIEQFSMELTEVWSGNWPGKGITVWILHDQQTDTPTFQVGDHAVLAGRFNCNADGTVTGVFAVDPQTLDPAEAAESAFLQYSMYKLPADAQDQQALVQQHLEQSGLQELCETVRSMASVFTVVETADLSMVPTVADGTTFLTEGRELEPDDAGSTVCVISEALAAANGLALGDTIRLSVSRDCYTCESQYADMYRGWESGYPFEGDELLSYGAPADYEIVGIYSEIDRGIGRLDALHHSKNDIFIPEGVVPAGEAAVRSRSLTFCVPGPSYDGFLNQMELLLHEQGYTVTMTDTGWSQISGSFFAMESRRNLMLAAAAAAYGLTAALFGVLVIAGYKREYALRRLLGASLRQANLVWLWGWGCTAVPAGVLALLGGCGLYVLRIRPQAMEAQLPIPSDGALLLQLVCWTAAALIGSLAAVLLAGHGQKRRSLLKLLR